MGMSGAIHYLGLILRDLAGAFGARSIRAIWIVMIPSVHHLRSLIGCQSHDRTG